MASPVFISDVDDVLALRGLETPDLALLQATHQSYRALLLQPSGPIYADTQRIGHLDLTAAAARADIVKISFEQRVSDIHELTVGLRRCVRRLFVVAYHLMRRETGAAGQPMALTMQHLRDAYWTTDYEESRSMVERSRAQLQELGKPDPSYSPPWLLPESQQQELRREADRVRDKALEREREKECCTIWTPPRAL